MNSSETKSFVDYCRNGASFINRALGSPFGRLGERAIHPMLDEEDHPTVDAAVAHIALFETGGMISPEIVQAVFDQKEVEKVVEAGKVGAAAVSVLSNATAPISDILSPVSNHASTLFSSPVEVESPPVKREIRIVLRELHDLARKHETESSPVLYRSLLLEKNPTALHFLTEVLLKTEEILNAHSANLPQEELVAEVERIYFLRNMTLRVCKEARKNLGPAVFELLEKVRNLVSACDSKPFDYNGIEGRLDEIDFCIYNIFSMRENLLEGTASQFSSDGLSETSEVFRFNKFRKELKDELKECKFDLKEYLKANGGVKSEESDLVSASISTEKMYLQVVDDLYGKLGGWLDRLLLLTYRSPQQCDETPPPPPPLEESFSSESPAESLWNVAAEDEVVSGDVYTVSKMKAQFFKMLPEGMLL
ncbi:MAG: hypothetical protein KGI80_05725 [Verrucomicrobiota bacterium]|nr:hypothetical protein [Verrucomicrobiota bacterium]